MKSKRKSKQKDKYKVCAFYDTETTNIKTDQGVRAFPILFIFNRIKDSIIDYVPDLSDDISFYRYETDMVSAIQNLIEDSKGKGYIPIIAAYNLMFDLMPLMQLLNSLYDMKVIAQNTATIYTLDLIDEGKTICRFWDTWHLELNGLAAMGEICGFKKQLEIGIIL